MDDKFKRVLGMHQSMGNDLAKLGGLLRCKSCGYEIPLDADDIAHYLRHGWPNCESCDGKMRWLTQKELDAEHPPKEEPPVEYRADDLITKILDEQVANGEATFEDGVYKTTTKGMLKAQERVINDLRDLLADQDAAVRRLSEFIFHTVSLNDIQAVHEDEVLWKRIQRMFTESEDA